MVKASLMKPGLMKIAVQTEAFDLGAEVNAISHGRTDIGAIASFVGLARDMNEGSGVQAMTLEHYPGMTEKALAALVDEACSRWTLLDVTVIHRVGKNSINPACCVPREGGQLGRRPPFFSTSCASRTRHSHKP